MQDWFVVRNRVLGERINAPGIIDDEEDGSQPPVIAAPAARAGNPQVTAPPVRLVVNGDVIALDNAPDAAVVAADIVRAPVATGRFGAAAPLHPTLAARATAAAEPMTATAGPSRTETGRDKNLRRLQEQQMLAEHNKRVAIEQIAVHQKQNMMDFVAEMKAVPIAKIDIDRRNIERAQLLSVIGIVDLEELIRFVNHAGVIDTVRWINHLEDKFITIDWIYENFCGSDKESFYRSCIQNEIKQAVYTRLYEGLHHICNQE